MPHEYIDWYKKRQVDKTNAKVQNVYYATMVQSLKYNILNTHKLGRHKEPFSSKANIWVYQTGW